MSGLGSFLLCNKQLHLSSVFVLFFFIFIFITLFGDVKKRNCNILRIVMQVGSGSKGGAGVLKIQIAVQCGCGWGETLQD